MACDAGFAGCGLLMTAPACHRAALDALASDPDGMLAAEREAVRWSATLTPMPADRHAQAVRAALEGFRAHDRYHHARQAAAAAPRASQGWGA